VNVSEKARPHQVRGLPSHPFDGRTAFVSLSFTQKLTWLSEAVVSVYALARENPGAGCHAFFDHPSEQEKDPSAR
jgi:hypothetical protein